MIPACDFCHARSDEDDDRLFVEAPGGKVHICDGCLNAATHLISRRRLKDRETACRDRATVP